MKRTIKIIIIVFVSLAIFAILLFGLYFLTFNTNAWLKYPNPLKTQVAFTRLEMSSYEGICHEDCMQEQNALREIIADYLLKEPVAMSGQMKDYILDPEINNNFKFHILHILKEVEQKKQKRDETYKIQVPEYLVEYLVFPDKKSQETKRQIMSVFGEQIGLNPSFLDGLVKIIEDRDGYADERIQAMQDLRNIIAEEEEGSAEKPNGPFPKYGNIGYKSLCEMFVKIAEEDDEQEIKYAAVDNLYGCRKFKQFFTGDIFDRLEKLFYQKDLHLGVQDEILTAIYVYEEINKDKSVEAMKKIYNNEDSSDYIRTKVFWNFEKIGIDGYLKPEISDDEFRKLSNKASSVWSW